MAIKISDSIIIDDNSNLININDVLVGGALTVTGNLTVNGTQTIINTEVLDVEDKTIGIASVSSPTDITADGAGIQIYGDTTKEFVFSNSKQSFESNIPLATDEIRFITGAEKLDIVSSGNNVNLTYNSNSANSAIVLNPSGNVTLNVNGIPETSDFDNHAINFVVFVRSTGVAYSCLTVNLNGYSAPIHWVAGDSQAASSGVTTTSGYSGYHFSGINTVGSASTCENYVVLAAISGGYF